jgi:hypothetical protein
MGVWHVYKHACTVLYKMAAPYFIAPLHHHLWPDKKFVDAPKFRRMTHMLSIIRLSYANWKPNIQAAMMKDLPIVEKHHLRNLSDLLEFFIPMVHTPSLFCNCRTCLYLVCEKNSSNV